MKLDLLLAADYANITGDGKLNVMGIFREINADNFPTRLVSMHLVIRLIAELGEYGASRDLFVFLRDPDGVDKFRVTGRVDIPKGEGGIIPQVNIILELKDLVFPQPGIYQFVVMVDKDYKGDMALYVNQVETPTSIRG
ncbi:MAG: hypothetical protein JXB15_05875 [Anaerolineales bacterium]|nr:hypothetical protein [Anaerolineales bacterium]